MFSFVLPSSAYGQSSPPVSEQQQLASILSSLQGVLLRLQNAPSLPPSRGQGLAAVSASLSSGLVGYWNFDEGSGTTAADASGFGNTSTLTNGPKQVIGQVGQGLSFDGIDDMVNAGSASSLDDLDLTGGLSISVWIRPNTLGENSAGRIVTKDNNTATGHWRFQVETNNRLLFAKQHSGTLLRRESTNNSIALNTWQHVAVTWGGTSSASGVRFFVNGIETGYAVSNDGTLIKNSDNALPVRIGSQENTNNSFDGSMDEVRIYNRVLSSSEIKELSAAGSGGTKPISCVSCAPPPDGCNYTEGSCQTCGTLFCPTPSPVPTPTPTSPPIITSLQPTLGPIGTRVTINGSGFTPTGNDVRFWGGIVSGLSSLMGSSNGTTLSFTVTSDITRYCPPGLFCILSLLSITPGDYAVFVTNSNGTSNSMTFTVTSSTPTPVPTPLPSPIPTPTPTPPPSVTPPSATPPSPIPTPVITPLPSLSSPPGTPPTTAPIRFKTSLYRGLRNSDVATLQRFLIKRGLLAADNATGFFGNITEQAVKQFQASQGLPATGYVGPLTQGVLQNFAQPPSQQASPPLPTPTGITLNSLSSKIEAISWTTLTPSFASVEYKTTPFVGNTKQGFLFPLSSMSATNYTKVLSTRNDLCITDLSPNTLYYVRTWNKDAAGQETVSSPFTFTTPSSPANTFTFSKNWYGLALAEEWRSLDDARKNGAVTQPYIRNLNVLQQWDEIEPTPGTYFWNLTDDKGNILGIDNQLAEIQQRAGLNINVGKFITLKVRAGGAAGGKRMPDWVAEGVETVVNPDESTDKVVRWDPQYVCRYWQLVKAAGDKYGNDSRINTIANQATSKAGEMTMSGSFVANNNGLGYTDSDIARNMKWLYTNSIGLYAELFPKARITMNMGRIPVTDPDSNQEVTYSILDSLAAKYGLRVSFGTTGFGGVRADLQNQYKTRVVTGGMSEEPKRDLILETDVVNALKDIFNTLIWPIVDSGGNLGWVSLHDDALGILSKRWGNFQTLKDYLNIIEAKFAGYRGGPPPADTTPPTISLTAPLNGAVVRDTIAVSANASDNIGVAGVQFKLDGANLDAEDTASPYSISWDTKISSNGAHTLSAVARDAAGNTGTSPAVNVTVNNVSNQAPVLNPIGPKTVNEGALLTFTISATDADGDTLTYTATGLPMGATFTPATKTFSWTPTFTQAGLYNVTFNVSDGALTDSEIILMTVIDVSPNTKFIIGDRVQTTATLNVRATPSINGALLGTQSTGALGIVIGGPVAADDGFNWWNINYDNAPDGWSVEDFLVKTSPGLVGYWNFDEGTGTSAADSSGNNNTGTLTNGPAWVDGEIGKALSFDGVNDYVSVGNVLDFNATQSFTISVWTKIPPTAKTGTAGRVLSKGGRDSSNPGYQLMEGGSDAGDELQLRLHDGVDFYMGLGTAVGSNIYDNVWHHSVYVIDRSSNLGREFVDGVLTVETDISSIGSLSNSSLFVIGARNQSLPPYTALFYTGLIDDVRVYNRALSAAEVAQLYNPSPPSTKFIIRGDRVQTTATLNVRATHSMLFSLNVALLGTQPQ